jgi:hypothetical protein
MGQEMNARSLRGFLVAFVILSMPTSAWATGLSVGSTFYTIDISSALAKVPSAATAALQALQVPQADTAQIVAQISAGIADFPKILPIPLFGGAFEIPLPFGVIDTFRLSGGILDDGMVRGIASLFGTTIPRPLIDEEINEEGFQGTFTGDLSLSTFSVSAEAMKRFDLVLLGANLVLGLEFVQGSVTPHVSAQVPAEYDARVAAGLAALHTGGLSWSALAMHAAMGIEIGPPFLRLVGEVRIVLPLSSASGWWGIKVADWGWRIGFVMRL